MDFRRSQVLRSERVQCSGKSSRVLGRAVRRRPDARLSVPGCVRRAGGATFRLADHLSRGQRLVRRCETGESGRDTCRCIRKSAFLHQGLIRALTSEVAVRRTLSGDFQKTSDRGARLCDGRSIPAQFHERLRPVPTVPCRQRLVADLPVSPAVQ
jgi:hypothetical protein